MCLYHQVVTVSSIYTFSEVDHDQRPHTHEVAHDLAYPRHGKLSSDNGITRIGTWGHPLAVLGSFPIRDVKFCQGKQIERPRNRRWHLLQATNQKFAVETGVNNHPISGVDVSQLVLPTRNSNKRRRTTDSSYNWTKHWQIVRGIHGKTVWHSHGSLTKGVCLPRPHEGRHSHPTLLEVQAVQTLSLSSLNTRDKFRGSTSVKTID